MAVKYNLKLKKSFVQNVVFFLLFIKKIITVSIKILRDTEDWGNTAENSPLPSQE